MRLTSAQIDTIKSTAQQIAGAEASVWLFGSRLDDRRRGGDVDLLLQSEPEPGLLQRAQIKNQLEQALALPVDVVTMSYSHSTPFARMAKLQGQCLLQGKE